MDPDLQRVHDNIRRIIDADGPESDILAYLRTEGFGSREAWLSAWRAERNPTAESVLPPPQPEPDQPSIGPSGPTEQPPFPTLPPMVGGALDALVSYGTGLTFGAANAIPGVREYNQNLRERNPRLTTLLGAAGAATSIPVGIAGATAARGAAGMAGRAAGSSLLRRGLKYGAGYYLLDKLLGHRISQMIPGGNP